MNISKVLYTLRGTNRFLLPQFFRKSDGEPVLLEGEKGLFVQLVDSEGNPAEPGSDSKPTESYAKEYTVGNKGQTKIFKEKMDGFVIANDGSAKITFIINKMPIDVLAGEVIEMRFVPFQKVVVFSDGVPYRFWGLNNLLAVNDENPILAQDDFERTSTSGLGTAPTGQAWKSYDTQGVSTTNWLISSGKAKTSVTGFQTDLIDSGMSDFYSVEAEIKQASGGVASNYGGLMISYPDASNNLFFRLDSSDNSLRLYIATTPTTFTNLKQVPYTFTDGQVIKFKVIKKGKDIEIFADGVSLLTFTLSDADYSRSLSTKQGLFAKAKEAEFDKYVVKVLEV